MLRPLFWLLILVDGHPVLAESNPRGPLKKCPMVLFVVFVVQLGNGNYLNACVPHKVATKIHPRWDEDICMDGVSV
jgi:hypothetical protein